MGQKVSPQGLRIGINKDWNSSWIASKKDTSKFLIEDHNIREALTKKYNACGISKITIERNNSRLVVNIFTSRPGVLIGQKGAGIEEIKKVISKYSDKKNISVNIMEVKRPDLDAELVAQSVASQLEKRMSFKRAMKQAMQRVMKAGAKGCKIMVSGRLDGAEIARSEHYLEGCLPLSTLRSDIDYAMCKARTTFGVIGVKVWICKGEILGKKSTSEVSDAEQGGNN